MPRRILHLDMDAFFASVEQRDRPELRGRPVAVGGRPEGRGVVAAASYEARRYGVRSAMPMARAVRLCPELLIVRPDMERYRTVSAQVFALFRAVTPLVEPLSLDEAYLDVTENAWGEPLGQRVAARLKAEVRALTGLTVSAGVAPNKFLAKLASGHRKPDGLTVIAPERVEGFLAGLKVEDLWGVGPVTAERLHRAGLRTVPDLRAAPPSLLEELLGSRGAQLAELARGVDERPVEPDRPRRSLGCETTYTRDLTEPEAIRAEVAALAREAAELLADSGRTARTVTLKVRYADFQTVTRSETGPGPVPPAEVPARAQALLARTEAGPRPVRLLGVSLHGLTEAGEPAPAPAAQLTLPLG